MEPLPAGEAARAAGLIAVHCLAVDLNEDALHIFKANFPEAEALKADVAGSLVEVIHKDPQLALETHAREELGLDPKEGLGSPWGAASGASSVPGTRSEL